MFSMTSDSFNSPEMGLSINDLLDPRKAVTLPHPLPHPLPLPSPKISFFFSRRGSKEVKEPLGSFQNYDLPDLMQRPSLPQISSMEEPGSWDTGHGPQATAWGLTAASIRQSHRTMRQKEPVREKAPIPANLKGRLCQDQFENET